jgi:hypothetical protein
MTPLITINVINDTSSIQDFYFFQQPAVFSRGQEVYSNSLYSEALLPYATSGAILSFSMILQNYAGMEEQVSPPEVGQPSGLLVAVRPIDLTPADRTPTNNTTTMSISPSLGLSVPVWTPGPPPGSFRIATPALNPALSSHHAGSAVRSMAAEVTISSFVTVRPETDLDCAPVNIFYVQTGSYPPGSVLNFRTSSIRAALCDATAGFTTFNVAYNADGTWTVEQTGADELADGSLCEIEGPTDTISSRVANAEIRNEDATRRIFGQR